MNDQDFDQYLTRRLRAYTASAVASAARESTPRWHQPKDARARGWVLLLTGGVSAILAAALTVGLLFGIGRLADRPAGAETHSGINAGDSADADALFATTKTCHAVLNGRYSISVSYPGSWYVAPAIPGVGGCIWFAPVKLTIPRPFNTAPPNAVIVFGAHGGGPEMPPSWLSRTDLIVAERSAVRVEKEVDDVLRYEYSVPLELDGAPTLVAATSDENPGKYGLNKAILDRMMSTLVLTGTQQ
jgi:hypothetical protein